jgi:tetratricopeptide (TPR) repeat protein
MKSLAKLLLITLIFFMLMACQSKQLLQTGFASKIAEDIFLDEKFKGYQDVVVETEAEIFALSPKMIVMAESIASERDVLRKANKLLRKFFNSEYINLAYKSGANLVASEAFKNQEANCLSLTIMAYAIAKEAKLNVAFQKVSVPEYWVRNGRVNMLTGHINLSVIQPKSPHQMIFLTRTDLEIDFDPFINKKSFPKHQIDKSTVLAMFYNNKGANAMLNGDYVTAYAYFKMATQMDPLFSSAWGNLGILYRLNGFQKHAIDSYRYAINLNRNNLTAMENLSRLLHINGNYEEAKRLDSHIMRKRASNPYYYGLLGDEKFYQGAYQEAINHYRKAIKLNRNIHEFYFGLAKVYYMLDDIDKAKIYLKKAMAKTRIARIDNQYLAKLNVLKQVDQGNKLP